MVSRRLFVVLAVALYSGSSALAETITVSTADLITSSGVATPINSTAPFFRTGNFTEEFVNNIGTTITDFHFRFLSLVPPTTVTDIFDNNQTTIVQDGPFMDVTFQGGSGVGPGEHFWVSTTGFPPGTIFQINPTIPEPSTWLIFVCGGLGVVGYNSVREKLRKMSPL
jgi:hypothetical protein